VRVHGLYLRVVDHVLGREPVPEPLAKAAYMLGPARLPLVPPARVTCLRGLSDCRGGCRRYADLQTLPTVIRSPYLESMRFFLAAGRLMRLSRTEW
jgi:hypothetical protein